MHSVSNDTRGRDDDESGRSSLLLEETIDCNSCDLVVVDGDRRRRHHDHCHSTVTDDQLVRNKLIAVSSLCSVFLVVEVTGGLIANSLAIVSDASHLACDLACFLVTLFAIWIAKKPPTSKMSFGYHRAEILGALISILFIWVVTGILVYLGVKRIIDDEYEVYGETMLITACVGVAFNILMGVVLHSGIADCNVKSSFGRGSSLGSHHHSGSYSNHHHHHSGSYSNHHDHHHAHSHSHSVELRNSSSQNACSGSNRVHFHAGLIHNSVGVMRESSTALLFNNHKKSYKPAFNYNNQSEPCSSSRSPSFNQINCDDDDDETLIDVSEDRPPSPVLFISCDEYHVGHKRKKMNINIRAALVHVIGDIVRSIGVLIAAIIIYYKPEYRIADPICTFIFSFLVLCTTISILKDVVSVIMEAVPLDVNYKLIKADLKSISGIMTVHSLNVWALTLDRMAVNVHLGVATPSSDWQRILATATTLLQEKHKMFQSTIQVELYEKTMESCRHCHSD